MSEESKQATIKKVYEHPITGYGSINDTLNQASNINPNIKVEDVRDYLTNLKHRQTQFQYKQHNSFVSPHPLFEIEIDLVDLTSKAE